MLYALSGLFWLVFALILFVWTTPQGGPALAIPLGGSSINAAWLAILMVLWNGARYYQYTNQRKKGAG